MKHYIAHIPMSLTVPDAMHWAIKDVLEGEYELHEPLERLLAAHHAALLALPARWPPRGDPAQQQDDRRQSGKLQ